MAWKYRPHTRYYSIWSAEIGGGVRKNDKNSLLLLTMPVSFIATSHLMFSGTPLTIFWANYVEDEDDCESLALLNFNWVATGRPCVVGTCHISLRDCMCLLQVCTTERRARTNRFDIRRCAQNCLLSQTFRPIRYFTHHCQLYPVLPFSHSLNKEPNSDTHKHQIDGMLI